MRVLKPVLFEYGGAQSKHFLVFVKSAFEPVNKFIGYQRAIVVEIFYSLFEKLDVVFFERSVFREPHYVISARMLVARDRQFAQFVRSETEIIFAIGFFVFYHFFILVFASK